MEKIGQCKDHNGHVHDLFTDGRKFYRENPLTPVVNPVRDTVISNALPVGVGVLSGVLTNMLVGNVPLIKNFKVPISVAAGSVGTLLAKNLLQPKVDIDGAVQ